MVNILRDLQCAMIVKSAFLKFIVLVQDQRNVVVRVPQSEMVIYLLKYFGRTDVMVNGLFGLSLVPIDEPDVVQRTALGLPVAFFFASRSAIP